MHLRNHLKNETQKITLGGFVRGVFVLGGFCPGAFCRGVYVRGFFVPEPFNI